MDWRLSAHRKDGGTRTPKASLRSVLFAVIALLVAALACNLPRNPDEVQTFESTVLAEGGEFRQTAAVVEQQRIEQTFGGTRRYADDPSVTTGEVEFPCQPVYDVTHAPSLGISFKDKSLFVNTPQGRIEYLRMEPGLYCTLAYEKKSREQQKECLRFEQERMILTVEDPHLGICHQSAASLSDVPWTEADEQLQRLPQCLTQAYTWRQITDHQESAKAGLTCNGRFILSNRGAEPLYAKYVSSMDTGAMQLTSWKNMPLAAGAEGEERINHTTYKDGTVTCTRVEKLFVFRDVPECAWLKLDENQWIWEEKAQPIEVYVCP